MMKIQMTKRISSCYNKESVDEEDFDDENINTLHVKSSKT